MLQRASPLHRLLLDPPSSSSSSIPLYTEVGTHFNWVGTMWDSATEPPEKAYKCTPGSSQTKPPRNYWKILHKYYLQTETSTSYQSKTAEPADTPSVLRKKGRNQLMLWWSIKVNRLFLTPPLCQSERSQSMSSPSAPLTFLTAVA